jgi:signal peptidase I
MSGAPLPPGRRASRLPLPRYMARSAAKAPRSALKSVVELVVTVAVAVGLALLIQAFIVKPYRIPSRSMVPTLEVGQRVLVDRLSRHPSVGDIVVFRPPVGADQEPPECGSPNQGSGHPQACDESAPGDSTQTFIKRVVGGPGDTIKISNGHVYRDGRPEKDGHTIPCGRNQEGCNFPTPIVIPPGEYFMMGDNREYSDDSRFWGPVPDKWIIGVAFFTYWPPDRVGTL